MQDAIKALAKAQTEMGKAIKNASNPHLKSKYADLGAVMEACFEALHSNGFAVLQPCGGDERGQYVETHLAHSSGHVFTSRVYLVVGKQDMQGVGSAITYARRYGLLGMAGLAPEDDDGEATKAPPRQQQRPARQENEPNALDPVQIAIGSLSAAATIDALAAIWKDLPKPVQHDARAIAAKDARKAQLTPAQQEKAA
ncbi:ERF family protein [Paracoccus sp. SY]|uniref:ERF family protein n=1 Tax=Paracoccus sp. SY TaxID=1330255 RepID=UPI000CD17A4C|nr:ERF family protein [Paracoccus sp. SY]